MNQEIEFHLSSPIDIHTKGQSEKCHTFIMKAPSAQMLKYVLPLKQGFFNQIMNIQKNAKKTLDSQNSESTVPLNNQNSDNIDAQAVLTLLYMSELDLSSYFDSFKELCVAGAVIAKNNREYLTSTLLGMLTLEDLERLLAEYIANFIIGSLFQNMMKK